MIIPNSLVEPDIQERLRSLNLLESEYQKIKTHLQRDPNVNELAMFSVLWSEHCCYKNSRHLLRQLPGKGSRVVAGPGENAGVIDVGDGIQIAFKIESHNHPTAVEPFQGAATGVGGILRDIFTMNARPIANLNALRFGTITKKEDVDSSATSQEAVARNRFLLSGAVKGIAHYGNCVGVPTIAGDVFFEDCYTGNPLVNAMAVGILYDKEDISSKAAGVGNPVLYVGSATGKDGMGGAAFASKELDENSQEDRPAVQVGDPFAEKLLIEACLEAFATGCVVAAQDMGAAGLTSSSCEMAAKGNVGIRMDLDKVPAREPDMQAHEYLLSESQERMLFVLERGKEQAVLDVFAKWRVPAVTIGEVIAEEVIEIWHHGKQVVNVPAKLLTDLAPSYNRGNKPEESAQAKARRESSRIYDMPDLEPGTLFQWLQVLMQSPNIAKPVGITQQYDRHVQNSTVLDSDHLTAGVIRLRNRQGDFSGKALAVTVDCNPRYVYLNPFQGSLFSVVEAARNLACTGATPLAVSDNLNFGNPEKPEIYYQLYCAIQGIKQACVVLETPVVSGNVSLYNEHSGEAIYPTPTIGMIGLIEDETRVMSSALPRTQLSLALVGRFKPVLSGSEYQKCRMNVTEGEPPEVDLNAEMQGIQFILQCINARQVLAVQDVSTGGLLPTVCEMAFSHEVGIDLSAHQLAETLRQDERWFGETSGSYIIAFETSQLSVLQQSCKNQQLAFCFLGETLPEQFVLRLAPGLQTPLSPIKAAWSTTFDFL
jgi:phosphoribosylformylglycinamidine synthase subunit PurL